MSKRGEIHLNRQHQLVRNRQQSPPKRGWLRTGSHVKARVPGITHTPAPVPSGTIFVPTFPLYNNSVNNYAQIGSFTYTVGSGTTATVDVPMTVAWEHLPMVMGDPYNPDRGPIQPLNRCKWALFGALHTLSDKTDWLLKRALEQAHADLFWLTHDSFDQHVTQPETLELLHTYIQARSDANEYSPYYRAVTAWLEEWARRFEAWFAAECTRFGSRLHDEERVLLDW